MDIASLIITDQHNSVGRNDRVLEHIPAYLKYFEQITDGAPIIMGRKTFESYGHLFSSKRNIVITTNEKYHSTKARTFNTLAAALDRCKNRDEKKVFIIGGVGIFEEALPLTSEIYKTALMARFRSDEYYPEINSDDFDLESSICIKRDEENKFDYCLEKWIRSSATQSKDFNQ